MEHKALPELDEVHALINWLQLETQLNRIHSKARGEKAWTPLMMFKALLLQSWYTLSDPQLEKQLARDLLFRRFVGVDIAENVLDHSTLWRFLTLQDLESRAHIKNPKSYFYSHGDSVRVNDIQITM